VSRNAVVIDPTGKYHESRHSGLDPESSPGSKQRAANSVFQTPLDTSFRRYDVILFAHRTNKVCKIYGSPGVHATRGKEENETRKKRIWKMTSMPDRGGFSP
jgi:hypothetical protein